MSSESNVSHSSDFNNFDFNVVVPFGLITIILNGFCLIYLILRAFMRWIVTKKSLSMVHRVPFYIAFTEFNLFIANLINLSYTAIKGQTFQGEECKIIGGITFFCVALSVTLVGSLSLMTYLRICIKLVFDLGIFDYKLFFGISIISLILTLIGVNEFGPNKFWCYTKPNDSVTPIITILLIFLILLITLYCYIMTLLEVNFYQNNQDSDQSFDSNNSNILSRLELIVVRKIIAYILIFLIEWSAVVVYFISQMIKHDNIWIYTLAVVTSNSSGIGNAILYISYENWINKYSISTNSISPNDSNQNSNKSSNGTSKDLESNH